LSRPLATGKTVNVTDEPAHYMRNVLRLKPGHSLVVFNGEGGEYQATITEFGVKKSLILSVGEYQSLNLESPLNTRLAIAITRSERMDYAVQKAVELGVTSLVPLQTKYCVVKLNTRQAERKHEHWQRIAEHACEQCGRTIVPRVELPMSLLDWLQQLSHGNRILFHPGQSRKLEQVTIVDQQVNILIGPEGGFSESEVARAISAEFQPISLGPRVLRAETVVLVALSALQQRWGDL